MKKPAAPASLTKLAIFKANFKKHFFLRFHMMLILTGVFSSGLLFSKLLLETGLRSMLVRYLIVLVLSYLMFFVFIKLWLLYIRQTSSNNSSDTRLSDVAFIPDFGNVSAGGSVSDVIKAGGGEFGGGGASGDFADLSGATDMSDSTGSIVSAVVPESSGSSCLPGIPDIDLDDGGIVLIILGILLALIVGAGLYLVYAAPAILCDAALQVFIASSLYKASKKMDSPDWVGSIFRATRIPFAIMIILTIAAALVATHYYPGASKLSDVMRSLWNTIGSQ